MKINKKIICLFATEDGRIKNGYSKLKQKYPLIYKRILEQTSFLNKYSKKADLSDIEIRERLYCILNNLNDRPLCQYCHKNHVSSFSHLLNSYKKWCSPKCQASDPECIEKSKKTRLDLYGDENFNNMNKIRITRYENNNGQWHSDDFSKKVKTTKKLHFDDENFVNIEKWKNTIDEKLKSNPNYWKRRNKKISITKINNGHDPNWNNRDKFKNTLSKRTDEQRKNTLEKRRKTVSEKYGVDSVLKIKKFRNAKCDYYRKKYGVDFIQQTESYKKRIRKISLDRFGKTSYLATEKNRNAVRNSRIQNRFNALMNDKLDEPLFGIEDLGLYKEIKDKVFKFRCRKCGTVFESKLEILKDFHERCPKCFHPDNGSKSQKEIYDFLIKLFERVDYNTKKIIKPLELDIYIPERKFAIEYDGLYWHSEDQKDNDYHLNKLNNCIDKGIRLIHIFDDEWLMKKEIVCSKLKYEIGISEKYNSNNLSIREISNKIASDFMKQNCVFGSVKSSFNIGLFDNDKLISVMMFSKARFSNYEWELRRYSDIINYKVDNSFNILMNYFEQVKSPKSIIYFVDRRWENGYYLLENGFEFIKNTNPEHWYFKHKYCERIHQSEMNSKTINSICKTYDTNKTISENLRDNDYLRIFDCGKSMFVKNYNSPSATS